jgi:hypothetical protein
MPGRLAIAEPAGGRHGLLLACFIGRQILAIYVAVDPAPLRRGAIRLDDYDQRMDGRG